MSKPDCPYPQHHNDRAAPGILQLVALLIVVGVIAVIITHWKAVVACIAIAGVVMVLVFALMALYRNHGSGYDPELERQAALERDRRQQAAVTSAPPPAVAAQATTAALEPAPVVHQHLHLHGISSDDMADAVRKAIHPPGDHHR